MEQFPSRLGVGESVIGEVIFDRGRLKPRSLTLLAVTGLWRSSSVFITFMPEAERLFRQAKDLFCGTPGLLCSLMTIVPAFSYAQRHHKPSSRYFMQGVSGKMSS